MKLILILSLFLSSHALAQAETRVVIEGKAEAPKVSIQGPAAETLYQAIRTSGKSSELPCGNGYFVKADGLTCVFRDKQFRCYMNYNPEANAMQASDICERPEPSIIGVGNFRPKKEEDGFLKPLDLEKPNEELDRKLRDMIEKDAKGC